MGLKNFGHRDTRGSELEDGVLWSPGSLMLWLEAERR